MEKLGLTKFCYPVITALAMVCAIVLLSATATSAYLEKMEAHAEILNVAGRQRMLCARFMAGWLARESASDSTQISSLVEESRRDIDFLTTKHDYLKHKLIVTYPELATDFAVLESSLKNFSALIHKTEYSPNKVKQVIQGGDEFIDMMDKLVFKIQLSDENEHKNIQSLIALTTLATILLTIILGNRLIRPVIKGQQNVLSEEKILRKEFERLSLVARLTSNAVIITNRKGEIEWVNAGFERMTEYAMSEVLGKKPGDILQCNNTNEASRTALHEATSRGQAIRCEILNRSKSGREYWLDLDIQPIYDAAGLSGFISIESDITERRVLQDKAYYDPLTQLANRGHFLDQISLELARLTREGKPLCLMMIDVDFFKPINDTYGHAVGDQALSRLAELIRATVRQTDTSGRIGGEEFAILLPNTDEDEALYIAERLRCRVEREPILAGTATIYLTVSIGLAQIDSLVSASEALKLADEPLYEAKRNGRNRVICRQQNPIMYKPSLVLST